jgi:hypothetical protein
MPWGNKMKWLIALFIFLLTGCVYAPLPELPVIEHISQQSNDVASQCPSLPMPEPIPKQMRIEIGYGADKADDNGIRLLDNYKDLRKKIKATWHAKPP